jgi:Nitroreductase
MKQLVLILVAAFATATLQAQGLRDIKLNQPNKDRGASLMKALDDRKSVRAFSDKQLSDQDLSDLLWAANGVNRPDGRRTAPTARNNNDIDIYLVTSEGIYLYVPVGHELQPVVAGDFSAMIADNQEFAKEAPVYVLIVSDYARFTGLPEATQKQFGALDAGMVSQNISLFASSCGFVTVPRAFMQRDKLKEALKLKDSQEVLLNHPIGYPKQ